MGVTGHAVYQALDDPNDVTVWHDFATRSRRRHSGPPAPCGARCRRPACKAPRPSGSSRRPDPARLGHGRTSDTQGTAPDVWRFDEQSATWAQGQAEVHPKMIVGTQLLRTMGDKILRNLVCRHFQIVLAPAFASTCGRCADGQRALRRRSSSSSTSSASRGSGLVGEWRPGGATPVLRQMRHR